MQSTESLEDYCTRIKPKLWEQSSVIQTFVGSRNFYPLCSIYMNIEDLPKVISVTLNKENSEWAKVNKIKSLTNRRMQFYLLTDSPVFYYSFPMVFLKQWKVKNEHLAKKSRYLFCMLLFSLYKKM